MRISDWSSDVCSSDLTKAVAKPLTPEAEHVLRRHGTERPGSSKLNHEKRPGVFRCAGCGTEVFASDTKYESGSGWPSFWAPAGDGAGVATTTDRSHGMTDRKSTRLNSSH